jgi:hypothetical protein
VKVASGGPINLQIRFVTRLQKGLKLTVKLFVKGGAIEIAFQLRLERHKDLYAQQENGSPHTRRWSL